ncbi:MAG: hypothetical protein IJE46_02735 [Clostridia bacterium]|nr:hypothetical protein [Clostridia bacterium]
MINVLLTYTTLIPSVRFCAFHPLKFLSESEEINLVCKMSHKVTASDLNFCDVLVMVRCCEDRELEIAQQCKKAGIKIVYVIDDDLLNVPDSIEGYEYFGLEKHKKNLIEIMSLSDVLWSPNCNLIKKYGHFLKKSVLIDEPFIGDINAHKYDSGKIRIGFAGTATHRTFINDFLGDVLKIIKNTYKDKVSIEFFGFKPDFIKEIGGQYIPYCDDYEAYCKIMRERNWDIGLAPLEENEFTSCKYFNKYIEYSSYGIVGVYSAVQPYTFGINNGVNGLLAENTVESWVKAIKTLVEDKELLKEISQFAQVELQTKFNVESVAEKIFDKEIFIKCTKKSTIKYRKKSFVAGKFKIYMQIYGIFMPIMVVKKCVQKTFRNF